MKSQRKQIESILRKDPAFIKGRKKMLTVEPPKGKVIKVPLSMIVPAKPDTGWLKPEHDVYKCLMCDFGVFDVHNRKMDKCPYCGFDLIKVDAIGLLEIDGKHCVMTEPN